MEIFDLSGEEAVGFFGVDSIFDTNVEQLEFLFSRTAVELRRRLEEDQNGLTKISKELLRSSYNVLVIYLLARRAEYVRELRANLAAAVRNKPNIEGVYEDLDFWAAKAHQQVAVFIFSVF